MPNGVVVSTGKKWFSGVLFGVVPQDALGIFITVADAKDGRVMATVSGFALGSFLKKPDKLIGSAIDKAFKTFPSSGAMSVNLPASYRRRPAEKLPRVLV